MTDDGESCASSSDSDDRPVKKARFLWEIKGRYHLKKEDTEARRYAGVVHDVYIPYNAINKWQNQQMAKAMFDNTVNSVIENLGFSVPVPDLEYIMDGFNGQPRNASNNGNLEDEAVEMAIRSHGLQKPCSCPEPHSIPSGAVPFHRRSFDSSSQEASSSTSSAPEPSSFLKEDRARLEHDFLAEAVAVAIQKKGLGAFNQSDGTR